MAPPFWERPERASYSPRIPITGPPSPQAPQKAVGMPHRPSVTSKPAFLSSAQYSAAALCSLSDSSGAAQTASETPVKIPAFSSI